MSLSELLPSPVPPPLPFDPAVMHPAAILSEKERVYVSEFGYSLPETIHPAALPGVNLVKDGYGELILRVKDGSKFRPVTEEEYAKAYEIFRKYAPGIDEGEPLPASRIEMMRKEITQINPNMIGTFIPRTLHDLIFIRKAIEEDVAYEEAHKGSFCNVENNPWLSSEPEEERYGTRKKIFISLPEDAERHTSKLAKIGHRLNTAACEMLMNVDATAEHFTLMQIEHLANNHINFLGEFFQAADKFYKEHKAKKYSSDFWQFPAIAQVFSFNHKEFLTVCKGGMGINSKMSEDIIRKAINLECQKSSIGKIIAYRGAERHKDSPEITNLQIAYSLSYGSGLFAGVVLDQTACAFYHMRSRPEAYAFVTDPAKENSAYFYTPRLTALESLFGYGELWHYRFRVSEHEVEFTGHTIYDDGVFLIKGPLSREELITKFQDLKKHNTVVFKKYES